MKDHPLGHPNLSDQINFNILTSEGMGGADVKKLRPGQRLKVTTKNTEYYIKAEQDDGRNPGGVLNSDSTTEVYFTIQGHERICPRPTLCNIHGSTWGGSMLKMNFVGVGMFLEFGIITNEGAKVYLTSEIQKVEFLS